MLPQSHPTSTGYLRKLIATTFCSTALEAFPGRLYGELEHLEEMDKPRYASVCFQNIYHIGDTKSGLELEVFLTMPLERLRLGCGIQCTETMLPLGPNQRPRLYAAALKLLRFALRLDHVRYCSEAEEALGIAMRPLLQLQDEHVLATLSAVVLALKEGRTGLPIGGVFGAGKVLLAGLLVYDPSLKLMVVTKENVAAHAIAEHLVALQLPQEVQQLMGRLVGYYEQRRKGSGTPLDLPVENRNRHIRQKCLLIGCGGGFLMECGQPYSPVSDWIKQVDMVLEDEGQQYGNMEEAATIARTPRTCFGNLVTLARFLQTEAKPRPAMVDQIWADLVGEGEVKVSTQVQTAAVVILRLAMPDNEVANARSTTWTGWQTEDLRGGFLPVFWDVPRANLHAVVDVGAVVDWLQLQFKFFRDAKSSLAVLHNQNDMVTHFKASSWVSEAQGAVVSRGVTTCAGMTAQTVIVAQTKIGFLTGGRRASFLELPQDEQDIQLEEAYGRATVALTRARLLPKLSVRRRIWASGSIGSSIPWHKAHLSCPLTLTFVPLGLHHFYKAFCIEEKANLRQDARAQFGLKEAELTSDLRLTAAAVLRMQWGQHKEQPKAPPARTARRDRVPPGVISPEQGEEEQGADEEEASVTCTDSEHSSNEQDGLPQDARTPLNEDSHQHGLMLAAYREVGSDYSVDNGQLVKGLEALKCFESVPRRWPLALLKSVEYLDRVLAGCCWEADDSIGALRQAAKSLILTLASYLADFELLHAASGHNVSGDGERKRPCSGLVKIVAKPRRAKTRVPAVDTACVADWIGGHCPADSLMIWFPAHWAPQVIRELESREHDFRQQFPQWFDEQFPAKYEKQYREALDSRTLHFHNRQYLKSSVNLLSAAYGEVFGPDAAVTARIGQGGLSDQRVSLCLPNQRDLDTWYEAVFALPIAWPDITDIDPHYLKKTSAHQLLSIRMQMGVSHMWGGLSPQWHLLKHHLWNLGPGYLAGRLEELFILKWPCRPGEDVHDSVLPTSHWQAWKTWEHIKKEIEAKATKAGVIWFVDEDAVVQHILEIISRDEIAMDVTYQEAREHDNLTEGRATKRRRRDGPSSHAPMVSTKGT
eukprot:symbB.v1.2.039533.t1/scaffold6630.1/size16587/2